VAREFVDFLQAGGFSWWQVLPFCMTDRFRSPYKSPAAFGGNPYFISLDILSMKGLLTSQEVEFVRQNSPWRCEYDRLEKERLPLLRLAASRIQPQDEKARDVFFAAHPQVAKVAEFMALRDANRLSDGSYPVWNKWTVREPNEGDLKFWRFVQSEFFMQWADLKAYANKRGVKILGDLPIYVDHDSCDV
jgi:4-alpha-glucanotransferase